MIRKRSLRKTRVDLKLRRAAVERGSERLAMLLERSRSFASLPRRRQTRFIRRAEQLIEAVSGPADLRARTAIDFPAFVADLIGGVFEGVVDASIRQMEAYADLLETATKSVEESTGTARRQQLLATMVLMGISRFDVERRRLVVRPCDD